MASRGRITIADVAKAAGVSSGTVSRVLNRRGGDIRISPATQKAVLEAVERMGYQPNRFASALRTQRTGVVGTIVRDINDPFLSLMARELQHAARAQGIELLLAHAENEARNVRRQLSFMRAWFDGLLLLGDMPDDSAIFDELRASKTPFAAVACGMHAPAPLVNIDEDEGIRLALDYLASLGHRRIGFIGNTEHNGTRQRLDALRRSVTVRDEYIQHTPYTRKGAIASTQRLLSLPEPPTAILCTADYLALGALSEATHMGWRVPEALSILSFDDIEEAEDVFPALTTVRQPAGEMASAAVGLLMQLIAGEDVAERRILVQPRLMIRRSCAPAVK